jgi:TonB family protein
MSTPHTAAPVAEQPKPTGEVVSTGLLSERSIFGAHDEHRMQRAFGASLVSIVLHGGILLILGIVFTYQAATTLTEEPPPLMHLVYLQQPGPGGGGGGAPTPAPPKQLEIPKPKLETPPPPIAPPPPVPVPPPPPSLNAPVMTMNAEIAQAAGTSSVSLATYGGGGRGRGLGSGSGDGVGPGEGGGTGGGIYRPGAGIVNPQVLREAKPQYTAEAMRLKIQGSVEIEAVVLPDGRVGDVKVTKSLDRVHGLDAEALKAARQWVFIPAKDRTGRPVPVYVSLILDFRIH